MTPEQFCYWLQGYFEIGNENNNLNSVQCEIIQDHLKLVFKKETPNPKERKKKIVAEEDSDFLTENNVKDTQIYSCQTAMTCSANTQAINKYYS